MDRQITLGEQAEQIIAKLMAEGRVQSADEAVEAGLKLLEQREARIAVLREALIEGEESGRAEGYSLKNILNTLDHDRH